MTVSWEDNCFLIDAKYHIQDCIDILKESKYSKGIYVTVTIVNPSHVNMAYLDLRAFNPDNNINHFVLTQNSVPYLQENPKILISPFGEDSLENFFIELPISKNGSIPSGSCIDIPIVVLFNPYAGSYDKVRISFKSTDTSLFHRSEYSDTNKKIYRAYEITYNLKNYDELLEKQISNYTNAKQ